MKTLIERTFPGRKKTPDRDIDDLAIFTVGTSADVTSFDLAGPGRMYPAFRVSPFQITDAGAGLMAERRPGRALLVGVVEGMHAHSRLSAHWPWIYKALVDAGRVDDAHVIAGQLLGPRSADCVSTQTGDPCFRTTQDGRHHEFFRRIGSTPFPLPEDGRDSEGWAFLGTELPGRRAGALGVLTWDRTDASQSPRQGRVYAQFNGKTRKVDYFRRKTAQRSGPLDDLPLDGRSNADWEYVKPR